VLVGAGIGRWLVGVVRGRRDLACGTCPQLTLTSLVHRA
jgi:hypothetical protein